MTMHLSSASTWVDTLAAIACLDESARDRLYRLAHPLAAPAGTRLFREGSPCQAYLILVAGCVRVQKIGGNGREIVLYRVGPGETCIVTTACLMSGVDYDAEGIAETDIQAQAIPLPGFRDLLATSASFRQFVFKAYGLRVSDLLMRIEEVAFGRIDARLAACLLAQAKTENEVNATHQELAVELGTTWLDRSEPWPNSADGRPGLENIDGKIANDCVTRSQTSPAAATSMIWHPHLERTERNRSCLRMSAKSIVPCALSWAWR
jgi:CRP/FNR family transcriptional regulator